MITSTKNYTKEKKMDRQNPRTSGKSKAVQTKSHKEVYTYTLKQTRRRENIYIYILKKRENKTNKQIY